MKTIISTLKEIILIACIIMISNGVTLAGKTNILQRYNATGFSIGSKGYMGTGYGYLNNQLGYQKDFWEYDPATDSWTQKAELGGAGRENAVGFNIGSKGYIGTGITYISNQVVYLQDFWEYDPNTNKWTQKTNFAGGARWGATGFSIGSLGYIGTGRTGLTQYQDFWEFNPNSGSGGTWTRKADFPGSMRYSAVGFNINLKGYLGTGIYYVSNNQITFYKDFYEYDPGSNTWTRKADVGSLARAFAVGFSIRSLGYIGTGETEGYVWSQDMWEYSPANNTWSQKSNFGGTSRTNASGFSTGTKGYIGTGYISSTAYCQDFWEYDQSTNVWTQKPDFGSIHIGALKDASIIGQDEMIAEELLVYPNPSNSAFNFRLQSTSNDPVVVKIFDMMGQLVQNFNSLEANKTMTIGDNLETGAYLVIVTQGDFRKSLKIIKIN